MENRFFGEGEGVKAVTSRKTKISVFVEAADNFLYFSTIHCEEASTADLLGNIPVKSR